MLKLNTVDGKFDIVFSGDPLNVGNQNPGIACRSRAARHKPKDKSNVLPKEQIPKGSRLKKDIPTKNNTNREKLKEPIPRGRKPPKNTPQNNVDKNLVNNIKINNVEKNINRKEVKKKDTLTLSGNKKEIKKKEPPSRIKKEQKRKTNTPVEQVAKKEIPAKQDKAEKKENPAKQVEKKEIPADNIANNSDNITGTEEVDNMRNNQFNTLGSNINNAAIDSAAGYITRDDLNEMFRGFFETTEPVNIKGSNGCPEMYPGYLEKHRPAETVEPLHIPGLGSSLNSMTPIKDSYSPTYQKNLRNDAIKNLQTSQEIEYNPWGRPGCGAPLKDKDHNTLADLRKYKSDINRSQSYTDRSVKLEIDHPNKLHSSLNIDNTSPRQASLNLTSPRQPARNFSDTTSPRQHDAFSTYARGQGKTQFQLEEIQMRRMKELEHQSAIKEQVEEKRRLKRLEKERELREEQQAEQRFRKEQEKILEMAERERRKQHEHEEKMRRHQEVLEEGIKRANIEAQRLKESMKPSYSSRSNGGETKHTNFTEEPIPYSQRRLHRADDVIVPANKFQTTDDEHMLNGNPFGNNNYHTNFNINNDNDSEQANEKFTQEEDDRDYISDRGINLMKKNNNRNKNVKSERLTSLSDVDSEKKDETLYRSSNKKHISDDNHLEKKNHGRTKTEKSNENNMLSGSDIGRTFESIFNDYLVPYHRTETTELIEKQEPPIRPPHRTETAELIETHKPPLISVTRTETRTETEELMEKYKPLLTSDIKKPVKEKRHPDSEHRYTQDSKSTRQQQILNQLNTLRQGLMQKEREYMEKSM